MTTEPAGAPAPASPHPGARDAARPPRSVLYNAGFATASAGSAVFLLALLVLAAGELGVEAYGRFSFALALAVIFETLMDFGLKEVTTRGIARDPHHASRYLRNTFGLKLVLGAGSLAAIALAAGLLKDEADVRLAAVLLGLGAVMRSYMTTVRSVFYGLDRFDLETAVLLVDRVLVLCLGAAALLAGYGVVGLAASFVVARSLGLLLAAGLAAREVGPPSPAFDLPFWRDLQMRAVPFGAFVVVLQLYNYVDTLMLGVMRGDAETGLYNGAYRVYEGLAHIPSIISVVLTPRLAREFVQDRVQHRKTALRGVAAAVLLGIPATVVTLFVAGAVTDWLYGPSYAASATTLRILSAGFVVVFPLAVLHAIAISVNAERLLLRTAVVGCLVNVVVNFILIPTYGMDGAALATIIGEAVSLAVLGAGMWGRSRE
jgi:O-antigen/teichoic acid export membrane protein